MTEHIANPQALRLLHIVEAFGGGVFEMVRLLAERSAREGHAVAIAYGRRPETPEDLDRCFTPAIELCETAWVERSLAAQLRTLRQLTRFAADWKPDVIHLHSSFAGAMGAIALGRALPTVYSPHGYSFEMRDHSRARRAIFQLIEAAVARRVTLIGAVSADEAELVRRKLRHRRVAVVRNGIPELDEPVAPRSNARARPLAVTMGRISPQRQPDVCARILHQVRDIADSRWIGGLPPNSPHATGLRFAGIPITGWIPRSDALAQLEQAQLYLHWTAWDGQPLSVLEAMARDVVVVAHDIPPLRELLDSRQLCETEQHAVMLIRQLLAEPTLRAELLADQRARATRFGTQRMVDGWHHVYRRVLAEQRPAPAPKRAVLAGHRQSTIDHEPLFSDHAPAPQPRVGGRLVYDVRASG
ncbi:MAG TPA: glycosyltransferase [Solirubrobacteraceae bacterium]|nr:glycosyltransferase [Solirubrobacteraceae bacterium]